MTLLNRFVLLSAARFFSGERENILADRCYDALLHGWPDRAAFQHEGAVSKDRV